MNVAKKWIAQGRYAKKVKAAGKKGKSAIKFVKKDLQTEEVRTRFKKNRSEMIHLRAGGRSRITTFKTTVKKITKSSTEMRDKSRKFYTLKRYKRDLGAPNANKAKVVRRRHKNKMLQGVVVTNPDLEGIFDLDETTADIAEKDETLVSGSEEILDDGELDEALEDAAEEIAPDVAGAMSVEQNLLRSRAASAAVAAAAAAASGTGRSR